LVVRAFGILLLALLAGGCTTTTADVIQARAEGLAQVYAVPPERAWRAARAVLDAGGAQAIEERRDESLMLTLTTVGAAGFVMPTRIAVWIEPVDGGTRVTVVSRQERGVLPRALSEAEFHEALARRLGETR
jgi:hypothetical protein